jgi:hypothetical protein
MEPLRRLLKSARGTQKELAISVKKVVSEPPIWVAPVTMLIAIRAPIIAYSIALTPESELKALIRVARIRHKPTAWNPVMFRARD